MKKLIVIALLCLSAMGMAQELSKDAVIEIGVVGTAKNFRIRTYFGPDEQNPAQDMTWERLSGNRVAFVVVPTQEYMVSKEGFKLGKIKLSPKDPLFSTYGSTFSNYNEFEQWAEDSLGESDGGDVGPQLFLNDGFLTISGDDGNTVDLRGVKNVVSYPNQGNVSFTMSVGTNEAPAAPYDYITESHLVADGKEADAALTGGAWKYSGDNSEIRFIANQNSLVAGNIGNAQNSIYWEAAFKVSGVFAIRFSGGDSQNQYYTLEIDGQDYPVTNPDNVNPGRRWLTVDAGDGVHFVKLKGSLNVQWRGYRTEVGAIAERWEYDKYSLFFGDSFTAGVGADYTINGYYNFIYPPKNTALVASGTGGAGYVNIGSSKALKDRIVEDYNLFLIDNGVPDEVIIAMGINDMSQSGIEQAANDAFDNLRSVYSGKIYVIGPWDREAPNSLDANYPAAKISILNALNGRSGFNFIDMEGVSYTKSDGTHPDTAGHKTLGLYLKKYLGFINL